MVARGSGDAATTTAGRGTTAAMGCAEIASTGAPEASTAEGGAEVGTGANAPYGDAWARSARTRTTATARAIMSSSAISAPKTR